MEWISNDKIRVDFIVDEKDFYFWGHMDNDRYRRLLVAIEKEREAEEIYYAKIAKQKTDKEKIEAGCDEAGRGCLAGPVVAAAVILPIDYSHEVLNDSKQLTEKQRQELKKEIIQSKE